MAGLRVEPSTIAATAEPKASQTVARRSFDVEPMNRMANLVEPYLDAGERSMLSFTAKRGPNPWLPIVLALVTTAVAYQAADLLPFEFFGLRVWVAMALGMGVLTAANLLFYKHRIVAVTNRSILCLEADTLNGTPTGVLSRVDRQTELGPARGLHARTEIESEQLWVPIRWRALLDVADRGRERPRTGSAADRRPVQAEPEAEIDLRSSNRPTPEPAPDNADISQPTSD